MMLSSYAFTCNVGHSARRYLQATSRRWTHLTISFLPSHRLKFYTQPGPGCSLYSSRKILSMAEHLPEVMLANRLTEVHCKKYSSSCPNALKDARWSFERGDSFTFDHSSIESSKNWRYGRIMVAFFNHATNSASPLNFYRDSKHYSSSFCSGPTREYSTKFSGSDHDSKEKQVTSPGAVEGSGFSSIARSTNSGKSESFTNTHIEGAWSFSYILSKGFEVSSWMIRNSFNFLIKSPGVLLYYLTHPKELSGKMSEFKEHAKKEANHYWMGMKLLAADIRTARRLLVRTLNGSALTRRERKQLLRTTSDLFRLVPMSMFIIIPFMEFALPFALKLFPNMLPSTFQDSLKAEENMKRELQSRIAMAGFFQETLQDLAKTKKKQALKMAEKPADVDSTAAEFLGFLEKARTGEFVSPEVIIRFSKYFQDELTLDNLPRTQLVNLCKYMSIPSYGSDPFLRFQLRHKIRSLKEDDQKILWEGIDSLTKIELSEACRERGMRSTGLSKEQYKVALQQWLDLSVNQNVPISLLIMSRSFFLFEPKSKLGQRGSVSGISDAISAMDKDILNQVVLEVATPEERSHNPEVVKISLQVLEHENEKIRAEFEERQASKRKEEEKKKADDEKKKVEVDQKKEEMVPHEEKILVVEENQKVDINGGFSSSTDGKGLVPDTKPMKLEVNASAKKSTEKTSAVEDFEKEQEQKVSLSAEELNAISQLISLSAVDTERAELERIKTAMLIPDEKEASIDKETAAENQKSSMIVSEDSDFLGARKVITEAELESKVSKENLSADEVVGKETEAAVGADLLKGISANADIAMHEQEQQRTHEKIGGTKLDVTMAHLQSKLEKMVGKIELQLSDVEMKIGNKMHFLDKDMDGLLTNEEVAQCLQLVLRRELTFDEAMAIANDMDTDRDGMFTVFELNKWIETNKIVKLAEQGRDAEVDKAIANAREKLQKNNKEPKESI